MLSIFGDESHDETRQRVFAVAGVMGTERQWNELTAKWLERTGGAVFHAADCEREYADHPDPAKHKQNLRLYADLVQLIVKSGLHGWGVGMDLVGFREFFREAPQDIAYYKCFTEVATRLIAEAEKLGEHEIKFTFDQRQQSEKNTSMLYSWMASQPDRKNRGVSPNGEVGFSSIQNPRIQVVDLVARETMKHLDNYIGPEQRPIRRSMEALATTDKRLQFDYLMREYFEGWRANMPELEKRAGFSKSDYAQWLQSNHLVDNVSNRIRFGAWLDAHELTVE